MSDLRNSYFNIDRASDSLGSARPACHPHDEDCWLPSGQIRTTPLVEKGKIRLCTVVDMFIRITQTSLTCTSTLQSEFRWK
jgi:hypothetical protein